MANQVTVELARIKRKSRDVEKRLYSADQAVAKRAEATLYDIGKALQAWAKKYRVKLLTHVETPPTGPAARRRCKPTTTTHVSDESMDCYLIGRDGRNCLYRCLPHTVKVTF